MTDAKRTLREPRVERAGAFDVVTFPPRYEHVVEVAHGGMGRVFRAFDVERGELVALKTLLDAPDAASLARFRRETDILLRLSHPALVHGLDHGVAGDVPFLSMEWIEGPTLAAFLGIEPSRASRAPDTDTERPTPHASIETCLVVLERVASALVALGAAGIVHRDLKPENVLLRHGEPQGAVVVDLGTARAAVDVRPLTLAGKMVGTPTHMAPEQAEGLRDVGPAADVWAFGVLAFEVLTGRSPFASEHVAAVLAKIVLVDPPDVREVRDDVPEALAALVADCLRKRSEERPHAVDVHRRVMALRTPEPGSLVVGSPASPASLGAVEQRLVVTGLVAPSPDRADVVRGAIGGIVREHLGEVHHLLDGTFALHFGLRAGTLANRATMAARAALALRALDADVRVALALGRADARAPGRAALDLAATVLPLVAPSEVLVNEALAPHLDGPFVDERLDRAGRVVHALRGRRPASSPTRTLLGRAAPWFGRERELGILDSLVREMLDEPRASVAWIVGEAGLGKSRLVHEWSRRAEAHADEVRAVVVGADAVTRNTPLVLATNLVRHLLVRGDDDPARADLEAAVDAGLDHRIRVAALAVRFGRATHDDEAVLAPRRQDPIVYGDTLRDALVAVVERRARSGPLLLVVEDLHWADPPSLRVLDDALRLCAARGVLLVVTARPDPRVHPSAVFAARPSLVVPLGELGPRASTRLVENALPGADADQVAQLVRLGAGHPLFLEELVRRAAEGDLETRPASVLAVLEARLDRLGPHLKPIVFAASVLGDVFTESDLHVVLGGSHARGQVAAAVDALVAAEVVRPRDDDGHRFEFRHALVRDAAYAMIPETERAAAHRRAALATAAHPRARALVVAEHFARSDEPTAAIPYFRTAAAEALEASEFASLSRHAERALALGAAGVEAGSLEALLATSAYWQSAYEACLGHAERAYAALPVGCAAWFRVLGDSAVSSARLGRGDAVRDVAARALATPADGTSEAFQARLVTVCRATFQTVFAGRFEDADRWLEGLAALIIDEALLSPATRAQVHHVRGVRAAHVGDVATFFTELRQAVAAFEDAGDHRNVALEQSTLGWCWVEVGAPHEALRVLDDSIARCERLGAEQATTYARVNLGYALGASGDVPRGVEVLRDAVARCERAANVRLAGWSAAHLAGLALDVDEPGRAAEEASRAVDWLAGAPGLRAWALAERARASLRLGKDHEAWADAAQAMEVVDALGGLLQHEDRVRAVWVAALRACGQPDAADAAATTRRTRLAVRAARFRDPLLRRSFLARPGHREVALDPDALTTVAAAGR